MRMRRIIMAITLFFTGCCVFGQKLRGFVYDDKGNPLESVSVSFINEKDEVLYFTFSDENGLFLYETKTTLAAKDVVVSCIGYTTVREPIHQFLDKNSKIELQESVYQLPLFAVTKQRIEEKNDTLVFDVASFANVQDKSIGDVISKMPGLEVRSNGQILFEGTPINKFYIEGLDLMGGKYGIANKNIEHRKIKEVEVLRNHQPKAVLRETVFSDRAAINLVLEDEVKGTSTHTINAAGGYGDKFLYYARILMMRFFRTKQNLSLVKTDNIGLNSATELIEQNLGDVITETEPHGSWMSAPFMPNIDIDLSRYRKNNTNIVSSNNIVKIDSTTTIRSQINLINDNDRYEHWTKINYFLADVDNLTINQSIKGKMAENSLDLCFDLQRNGEKSYFQEKLNIKADRSSYNNNITNSLNGIDINTRIENIYIRNNIEKTFKINKTNNVVSLNSSTIYNYIPSKTSLINGYIERLEQGYFRSFNRMSMNIPLTKQILFGQNVYILLQHDRGAALTAKNEKVAQSLTRGRMSYELETQYALYRAVYKIKARINAQYSSFESKAKTERWWQVVEPTVSGSANYTINHSNKLSLGYVFGTDSYSLEELFNVSFHQDFQTIRINKATVKDIKPFHFGNITYNYENITAGVNLRLSGIAMLSKQNQVSYHSNDDIFIVSNTIDHKNKEEQYSLSGSISKAMFFMKSFLKLEASANRNKGVKYNHNDFVDYNLDNLSIGASIDIQPFRFLSLEMGMRANSVTIDIPVRNTQKSSSYIANIAVPINKNLIFSLKNSIRKNGYVEKPFFFSNFEADYRRNKLGLSFRLKNILNCKSYDYQMITEDYVYTSSFDLRPREIILSIKYEL